MGYSREHINAAHQARLNRMMDEHNAKMEQARIAQEKHRAEFERKKGDPDTVRIVSAVKEVGRAIDSNQENLKSLGNIMEMVVEEIKTIAKVKANDVPVQSPETDWNTLKVKVVGRDYRGAITTLEINKES